MKAMTEQKDFENKLDELCAEFGKMTPHQRVEKLYSMFDEKEIMLTSSFAAISAMLLKVFSDVNKNQVIHFIQVITLKKLLLTKSI
jgi:phosphoadenosine phosphosulfate reductase